MIKLKKHDKRKERKAGFIPSLRFLVVTVVKRAQKKLWVFLKSPAPHGATTKHKKLDKIKEKRYSFLQSLRFLVATVVKLVRKKLWVFLKPNAPIGARSLVMFFSHKNRGQSLATIAVFLTAITLAGCGGGGGGSSGGVTPPPPLVPVNAVMTVSVTPSDGATSVARDSNVVMSYSVTAGTYTSTTGTLSCDGTSFVLAQTNDTTGKKVTFSPSTVLPYGSTCIAQGVATASGVNGGSQANISWKSTFTVEQLVCKTGEEVKDGVCVATILRYTDKVYALWTDKYPHAVTRTGVTRVKNMTQWSGLGKELFLCFIANRPLADGKILTLCKDLAQLKWHTLYIDPTKEEMYEYTDAVPSDLVYTVDPDGGIPETSLGASWLDVDKPTTAHPQWNSFAKVADGYFFVEAFSSGGLLKFIGNDDVVSIVADKNPLVNGNGTIRVMWSYSN